MSRILAASCRARWNWKEYMTPLTSLRQYCHASTPHWGQAVSAQARQARVRAASMSSVVTSVAVAPNSSQNAARSSTSATVAGMVGTTASTRSPGRSVWLLISPCFRLPSPVYCRTKPRSLIVMMVTVGSDSGGKSLILLTLSMPEV